MSTPDLVLLTIGATADTSSVYALPENARGAKFVFVDAATFDNSSFTIEEHFDGAWVAVGDNLGNALSIPVVAGISVNLLPENGITMRNPIRLKGAGAETGARTIKVQGIYI